MNKKDIKAIAAIIKQNGPDPELSETYTAQYDISIDLAKYFAVDNPKFNTHKFLKACGVDLE